MGNVAAVFGPDLGHLNAAEAARKSKVRFVRGRNELGVFDASRCPTGHVLTAWEAYQAYGMSILEEAVEYGSAILIRLGGSMEPTIRSRIEQLGLTDSAVARESDLVTEVVERAGHRSIGNKTGHLEHIGFILGLDELRLGYRPTSEADAGLAVRLRRLRRPPTATDTVGLSPTAVLKFAHSASVIRTQHRLQRWLGMRGGIGWFEPTDDYGNSISPAYIVGYELAEHARQRLNLGDRPISSMRELVERTLGIPVIQTRLPKRIAGATIAVNDDEHGEVRGIVLNTDGENSKVWVRRATLAHELGHLLFDPIQHLEHVRVDTYQENEVDPQVTATDYVEQRANAFAIAFLAPLDAVRNVVMTGRRADPVREIMETFGISHTAARYHITNSCYDRYELPDDRSLDAVPSDEQKAAEDSTLDYFPIPTTPEIRRGRFSEVVTSCYDKRYLSGHSAAQYMNCSKSDFKDKIKAIRDIYGLH